MSTASRDFRTDIRKWWWLMIVPVTWGGFAIWEYLRSADRFALIAVGAPAVLAALAIWFALKLRRFSVSPTAIEVTAPYQRKILREVLLVDIAKSYFRPNWPYRMGWLYVCGRMLDEAGAELLVPLIVLDTRGLSRADLDWIAQYPPLKVQSDNAT